MTDTLSLTAVVGGTGTTGCAYLVRHVLQCREEKPIGLITSRHSFVGHKQLQPLSLQQNRLLEVLGSMKEHHCTHVVLTLPPSSIASGEAEGLMLDTAIVTGLAGERLEPIYAWLRTHARRLVCNLDEEGSRALARRWQGTCLTYGENRIEADLSGKNLRLLPGKSVFAALTRQELIPVELSAFGGYEMYQALPAMACGLLSGVPLERSARALAHPPVIPGRVELLHGSEGERVLIDSAATPEALENLLYTARSVTPGSLLLVMDAPEQGTRAFRQELGRVCTMADRTYLTVDDPSDPAAQRLCREMQSGMEGHRLSGLVMPDRSRAIHCAMQRCGAKDTLVLSGRGDRLTARCGGREIPFDERALLRRYLVT